MTATPNTPTAESTRSVILERTFPHPPEKLWRALTETPLLAQWLLPNDFRPTPGHGFHFQSPTPPNSPWDGRIDCQVLALDPPRQLSYTWSALGLDSVVLWTLTPVEGGTHVRMEHSGFRPDQQAAYNGANYGWQHFLTNLDRVLNDLA